MTERRRSLRAKTTTWRRSRRRKTMRVSHPAT
jgi:hypothetical protein